MSEGEEKEMEGHDTSDQRMERLRALVPVDLGPLDPHFLSSGISVLNPPDPVCVSIEATVQEAVDALIRERVTCVLIVDDDGVLRGIYSERDYLLKDFKKKASPSELPICESMTENPVTANSITSVGAVMSLMALGGFRHVPVVDDDGCPVWMISMKLIVDELVEGYTTALCEF